MKDPKYFKLVDGLVAQGINSGNLSQNLIICSGYQNLDHQWLLYLMILSNVGGN